MSTFLVGIRFSFGVFFKSFESDFALTRTVTSSIYSVNSLFCAVSSLIGGWAVDRFGPRRVILWMGFLAGASLLLISRSTSLWQLYVSYSLLLAMGTGCTFIVTVTAVSRWFNKKRGLALGITGSGVAFGTAVLAPSAAYLISNFGWRMSFVAVGLMSWLVVMSLSRLVRNSPAEIGTVPDGVELKVNKALLTGKEAGPQPAALTLLQAFRTSSFWLTWAIWLFMSVCVNLILAHSVPYATDVGISNMEAATVITVIGVVNILSRVATGRILDVVGRKVPGIAAALLLGGALVWLIWCRQLWMFYVFAIAFGASWGGLAIVSNMMVVDAFGGRNLGKILGAVDVGFATGSAIGPAIGGLLFDTTGAYTAAFIIASATMLLTAGLVALFRPQTANQAFESERRATE